MIVIIVIGFIVLFCMAAYHDAKTEIDAQERRIKQAEQLTGRKFR